MARQELKFPVEFIDRKAEQEIFDSLVQFNDNAHLLVIEDGAGTGKSTLLEMLTYKCKYTVDCPVGHIQLDANVNPEINSPFVFIERLRETIGLDQTFEQFDKFNEARVGKNASIFSPATSPVAVQGSIAAGNAVISGTNAELIGAQVNYYGIEWTSAQEEQARRRCIRAFFEDLKTLADANALVVLLDSYDRCSSDLKSWIIDEFVRPLCFNVTRRPQQLLMVLAGQEVPDFAAMLQERYVTLVRSRRPLSGWQKEHVKDFLRVHEYGNLSDKDVDTVWDKIQQGFSIRQALLVAHALMGLAEN
jgi:hypothetical protein